MPSTEYLKEKIEEVRCRIDSWRKTRIRREQVPEAFVGSGPWGPFICAPQTLTISCQKIAGFLESRILESFGRTGISL